MASNETIPQPLGPAMSSKKTQRHGVIYRLTYAIGFLIGAVYGLLVFPFYGFGKRRRFNKFVKQDRLFND